MFQLVVVCILLWAGVSLVVSLVAVVVPVIALVWVLMWPNPAAHVVTLLVVAGIVYWLVAGATVLACGGLFYTANWLLYQSRRSVGPTVLLVTWTLFAVPTLSLSPLPFLALPPAEALAVSLCLVGGLALVAVLLGLGLRFYLHSAGVWNRLS